MASRSVPPWLASQVERSYRRLAGDRASVLLAVSGGADSMALLRASLLIAPRLGLRLEVATLDHGARAESAEEVRTVAARCAALGLPCHVRALGLSTGPAFEERARDARRVALEQLRAERGLDFIATAHTANDQAETVLMRLSRGSALRGAAAIHERSGVWIRPLLFATRDQVLTFLGEAAESFVTDPMNADRAFLRARLRHDVLPALIDAAGPSTVARLADFARAAGRDERYLRTEADRAAARLRLSDGAFDRVGLLALPEALRVRVLVAELERHGVVADSALLERLGAALEAGDHRELHRGFSVHCEGGRVRLVARRAPGNATARRTGVLSPDGALEARTLGWSFRLSRARPAGGLTVALPASLVFPLNVRARTPGDRVRGARGWIKLHDLLIDRRIPAEQREDLPIVVDAAGTIRWVVGVWPRTPPRIQDPSWFLFAQRANDGERGGGR